MKKVVLCLFFLFFDSIGFGQANLKLDSLKRVLAKLPAEGKSLAGDTLRVNFYLYKSDLLFFKNIDSVKLFTNKALQLSRKINWKQGEARSLSKIGMWTAGGNELFQAVDYFYKALLIFEELNDINGIATTKRSLGDCYSLLGNFEKAIAFNNESLQILKESKNQKEYVIGINNLALAYHDAGQYKNAIQTFQNGIHLAQNSKLNISPIYFKINLAISFLKNKEIDKSITTATELLKLPLDEYNKSILYSTLADCNYEKGKFEESKIFIKLSEKEIQKIGGNKDLELVLSEIGNKVFSALKEPVEEVKYLRKFHSLNALKTKQDEEKRIRNLQFEYENENQKKEIGSLKTNRIYLIFILSIIAITGSILMAVNQKLKKQKVLIEKQKLDLDEANNLLEAKVNQRTAELSSANAELIKKNFEITEALFKGQTIERKRVAAELHDNLGSTLSALKWRLGALNAEALSQKEKEIYESIKTMMGIAYEEVRYISHNLLPAEFEKYGLIGAIEKLCREINNSGKINIQFKKTGNFSKLQKNLSLDFYSIALELINNILKHTKALTACIELTFKNQTLIMIISDDDKFSLISKEGFGIQNLKNRLKSINGNIIIVGKSIEIKVNANHPVA